MEMNGKSSAGDCVKVSVEVPKYTIAERKREIEELLTESPVQDGPKKLNDRYVFGILQLGGAEKFNLLNKLIGFIIVFLVIIQRSAMFTWVS